MARISTDMGRVSYAWRGFLLIWGGFLRRGANSSKYGANLQRVARIHTDMGRIFAAWRELQQIWGELRRRGADSGVGGANIFCLKKTSVMFNKFRSFQINKKIAR